jgi:hypothetical protein
MSSTPRGSSTPDGRETRFHTAIRPSVARRATAWRSPRHTLEGDGAPPRLRKTAPRVQPHTIIDATHPDPQDTRAWKAQVWISFATAVVLCAVGLPTCPARTSIARSW